MALVRPALKRKAKAVSLTEKCIFVKGDEGCFESEECLRKRPALSEKGESRQMTSIAERR
jgi:hypothetical protein